MQRIDPEEVHPATCMRCTKHETLTAGQVSRWLLQTANSQDEILVSRVFHSLKIVRVARSSLDKQTTVLYPIQGACINLNVSCTPMIHQLHGWTAAFTKQKESRNFLESTRDVDLSAITETRISSLQYEHLRSSMAYYKRSRPIVERCNQLLINQTLHVISAQGSCKLLWALLIQLIVSYTYPIQS